MGTGEMLSGGKQKTPNVQQDPVHRRHYACTEATKSREVNLLTPETAGMTRR